MTAMGSSDHDVTKHSLSVDDELIDYLIELLVRSSRFYASDLSDDEVRTITGLLITNLCETDDTAKPMFDTKSLLALYKVFGVMTKDKLGNAKDFNEN